MTMIATPNRATTPLTALDRCDRCGAQAYFRVVLTKGELLFCAHHGRQYRAELKKANAQIHDESSVLSETPPTASRDER